MKRLKSTLVMLAVTSAMGLLNVATRAADAPAKRPNVIIMLADDMGYSDIGCYGGEIDTPNIDKLASEGVRFSEFYNCARCCPTRASLLTGLYPHEAGMGWMAGHPTKIPGYEAELTHDSPTIAEVMKSAGYATYMTGKWHVTSHMAPRGPKGNWPLQRGFEHYYGSIKGGGSYYDPATLTRQNKPITPDDDPDYHPEHYYYTDAIGDQASRYIKEHHEQDEGKPMFMYVAFTSPHWPAQAPEETIAKYKGKYDGGYEPIRQARFERMKKLGLIAADWQLTPQWGEWDSVEHKAWEARCMEVYAAQVDRMDQNVGKIVAALKQAGEYDNTLLLFLSDNGGCAENMGRDVHEDRAKAAATQPMKPDEVELDVFPKFTREGKPVRDGYIVMPGPADTFIAYGQGWANVSNTPFKEYKHWVHEGGISTPLIAHWPAGISRQGVIETQPGHVVDLLATAADVGQAKDDKPIDGVSLAPAFAGKPLNRSKPIFWEHEGNRAVREDKWKLVATGADGEWELYDMDADRTEMHDLAGAQPERVKTMAAAWESWAAANKVLPLQDFEKKPAKKQAAQAP